MNPHDEKELSRFMQGKDLSAKQDWDMMCLRQDFIRLSEIILEKVPVSADRSAALRYLRLAMFQCQASIAHDYVPKFSVETVDAATLK